MCFITQGISALGKAIVGGHLEIVKVLIEAGVDIDETVSSVCYLQATTSTLYTMHTIVQQPYNHRCNNLILQRFRKL